MKKKGYISIEVVIVGAVVISLCAVVATSISVASYETLNTITETVDNTATTN